MNHVNHYVLKLNVDENYHDEDRFEENRMYEKENRNQINQNQNHKVSVRTK